KLWPRLGMVAVLAADRAAGTAGAVAPSRAGPFDFNWRDGAAPCVPRPFAAASSSLFFRTSTGNPNTRGAGVEARGLVWGSEGAFIGACVDVRASGLSEAVANPGATSLHATQEFVQDPTVQILA